MPGVVYPFVEQTDRANPANCVGAVRALRPAAADAAGPRAGVFISDCRPACGCERGGAAELQDGFPSAEPARHRKGNCRGGDQFGEFAHADGAGSAGGAAEAAGRGRENCELRAALRVWVSGGVPGGCVGDESAAPALFCEAASQPGAVAAVHGDAFRGLLWVRATILVSLYPNETRFMIYEL